MDRAVVINKDAFTFLTNNKKIIKNVISIIFD